MFTDMEKTSLTKANTKRHKEISVEKRMKIFFIGMSIAILVTSALTQQLLGDDCFMIANWRAFLHGGFYQTDPLSMHHEFRCSLEKWLSCAIVYYLYTWFGLWGLRIAVLAMSLLIAFLQYRLCLYTSENDSISLLFAFVMATSTSMFLTIRPQTITTVLLLVELFCLEHWTREQKVKWLIPLPFLAWIEMQIHSTIWPCFFMVIAPYLADLAYTDKRVDFMWKQKVPLLITTATCAGSLFLNPYGAWSVLYIFRSYGDKDMSRIILELLKPTAFDGQWSCWLVITAIAFAYGNKKLPARYWLLLIGFLLFSCTAYRNVIFICSLTGFIPCYMFREKELKLYLPLSPVFILSAICVFAIIVGNTNSKYQSDLSKLRPVFAKMEQDYGAEPGMDVFCDFDSGSYAEYLGYHPYIDGRAEVFLKKVNGKKDVFAEFAALRDGNLYYKDFLNRYDFDFLIVDKSATPPFYESLANDPEVERLFDKNGYTVFRIKQAETD